MAVSFNQVKTYIPGVGYRAYIWSLYTQQGLLCEPNQLGTGMWECLYLFGEGAPQDSWQGGGMGPLNGLFPNIGEWVSVEINQTPTQSYILCYKLLEIVDEATFTTGTCTSCYNHGYGGQCSDAFITVPPLPGDPAGCLYTNLINPQGIVVGDLGVFGNPTYTYTAWISSNCEDCTGHIPPVFEPNMFVNCCDPSERYQFGDYAQLHMEQITGTSVGQLGVNNFTQAFRADLYIGGNTTGYKCWHLGEEYPPFGPTVYTIPSIDPVQKYPDCGHLNHHLTNSYQPPYPPCCEDPPVDECEPPFAMVAKLTSKLDKFRTWKNKSLAGG